MTMPETANADKEIQEYSKMLESQLQTMYEEYQSKAGEFQANEALMTEVVKEAKIKEIQDLESHTTIPTNREGVQQKEMKSLLHFLKKLKMLSMRSLKKMDLIFSI